MHMFRSFPNANDSFSISLVESCQSYSFDFSVFSRPGDTGHLRWVVCPVVFFFVISNGPWCFLVVVFDCSVLTL